MTKSRSLIAPRRVWSEFELEVMRKHYPITSAANLAELFNREIYTVYAKAKRLGLAKSPEFLASPASGRTGFDGRGQGGQFRKGLVPANKGKKFPGRVTPTTFQKGQVSVNTMPIGSYRVNADGFVERKFAQVPGPYTKRWIPAHREVWIAANGPIPAGHVIAFKPGKRTTDPAEISLEILECLTFAENLRRNSFHRHGPEIAKIVQLRGAITRQINKRLKESQ